MKKSYYIIEFANTHGGDFKYLKELLKSFEDLHERCGVKFQAFHPDRIATADYSAYDLYKLLHFDKKQWREIINQAFETKDVWLDIFDTYGVEVLQENITSVHGIKFQSSVLYNHEVFNTLQSVDLTEKNRDYRLTLDYPEDLEMFNRLHDYFDESHLEFDLRKALAYLDSHPEISGLNAHLTLRYRTDQQLIDTLDRVTKIVPGACS